MQKQNQRRDKQVKKGGKRKCQETKKRKRKVCLGWFNVKQIKKKIATIYYLFNFKISLLSIFIIFSFTIDILLFYKV